MSSSNEKQQSACKTSLMPHALALIMSAPFAWEWSKQAAKSREARGTEKISGRTGFEIANQVLLQNLATSAFFLEEGRRRRRVRSERAGAPTADSPLPRPPPCLFRGTLKHASDYVRTSLPFGVTCSRWVCPEQLSCGGAGWCGLQKQQLSAGSVHTLRRGAEGTACTR